MCVKKALKIIGGVLVILLLMGACSAAISDSNEKPEKTVVKKMKKPKKVVKKVKPVKVKEEVQTNFDNCQELNAVYPDGVDKKHPAYQKKMDRNKDGFACERN